MRFNATSLVSAAQDVPGASADNGSGGASQRLRLAFDALARPVAEFRAALSGALEQAEALSVARMSGDEARRQRAVRELGHFGAGRVDPAAFMHLFDTLPPLPDSQRERLGRAVDTLRSMLVHGDDLFLARVPAGDSIGAVVETALSRLGRAFGALLSIELIRSGAFVPAEHDRLLDVLAFRSWTRTERRYAPPLIVLVGGADLRAGELATFMDGREKLVLVVEEPCPPAPLVRLVTPGALVLQTGDATGLDLLATSAGPGIAAIVPDGAACFLHDPARGREAWQRLSVWRTGVAPERMIGGASVWQMQEDLRQLEALAAAPLAPPLPAEAVTDAGSDDAVDRLASWLLAQSPLGDS